MNEDAMTRAIIDRFCAAALEPNARSDALNMSADLFGSVGARFEVLDKTRRRPVLIDLATGERGLDAPRHWLR